MTQDGNRNKQATAKRNTTTQIIVIICCFVILFIWLLAISSSVNVPKPKLGGGMLYELNKPRRQFEPQSVTNFQLWNDFNPVIVEYLRLEQSFNAHYSVNCRLMSDWDKLRDRQCHAEWLHKLKNGKIVDVDIMLGFSRGKRNALRVVFDDGSYGWFKACPGEGEDPRMEVAGYLIDNLLGLHTIAPAVPRSIHAKDLEKIVQNNPAFLEYLTQADYVCSSDGLFNGVMLGWWNDVIETSSPFEKKKGNTTEIAALRKNWNALVQASWDNPAEYPIKELPRNHILLYLLNILQHQGHNEFRVENGHLVTIDVDRTEFLSSYNPPDFGLQHFCKVDKQIYSTLSGLSSDIKTQDLPSMLYFAMASMSKDNKVLNKSEMRILQTRIDRLIDIFDDCFERYGREDVLFTL